jgi:signal peptidase I
MWLDSQKTKAVVEIIREKIALGGESFLTVTSGSMRPLLNCGDKIVVKGCLPQSLSRGDIIIYAQGYSLCAHRFLYKQLNNKGTWLVAKGDYRRTMDEPFPSEFLLGRVVAIKKKQQKINLENRSWQIINWVLAIFSLAEGWVFKTIPRR